MEQRDGAPVPGAAPARGGGAQPSPRSGPRPTSSRDDVAAPLPCLWGASTGALPLAVVDAIPGDLEGPRAGAHGCATFLSLVSLSSKAPALRHFLSAGGNLRYAPAARDTEPKRDDSQSAPLLTHILSCQLSAAESHCLQRWTNDTQQS